MRNLAKHNLRRIIDWRQDMYNDVADNRDKTNMFGRLAHICKDQMFIFLVIIIILNNQF